MNIPYLSFAKVNADVKQELTPAFEKFIDSNRYILGDSVSAFEDEYASYCSTNHCIGVANGLDALIIALKSLNIGPGDEVIVPSNTYIATWLAVSYTGALPVPVEPRLETYNISPELIEAHVTSKTRAIIPVHLFGQSCEMTAIMKIAERYGLYVIEDNAQAQGAKFEGKVTGGFGHINATSFYPGKNLGAYGDAGAINTNDEKLAERVRTLRNYGSQQKYYNDEKGFNSRLDELQAAFLSIKLRYLNTWNQQRAQLASIYDAQLKDVGDIVLPRLAENATSVHHIYCIRTERRDELQQFLHTNGIGTLIHYPVPPHLQKAYADMHYAKGAFPLAEQIAKTCLSLPLYPGLSNEAAQEIVARIKDFYNG